MSQMWTHRHTHTQTEKDVNPIVDTRLDSQNLFDLKILTEYEYKYYSVSQK